MQPNNGADQRYITYNEASNLPWLPRRRKGKKLNKSTMHRWSTNGLNGVKLKSAKVGQTPVTTEAWMREFFESLANPADGTMTRSETPARRVHAVDSAMRELAESGIG